MERSKYLIGAGVHEGTVSAKLLVVIRCAVSLTWIYEGLWSKIVLRAPHELKVVESVAASGPMSPVALMTLIGCGETLLGLAVLGGFRPRFLAWVQMGLLLAMNGTGVVFGKGSIDDPLGLLVKNLPFALCIVMLGLYDVQSTLEKGATR